MINQNTCWILQESRSEGKPNTLLTWYLEVQVIEHRGKRFWWTYMLIKDIFLKHRGIVTHYKTQNCNNCGNRSWHCMQHFKSSIEVYEELIVTSAWISSISCDLLSVITPGKNFVSFWENIWGTNHTEPVLKILGLNEYSSGQASSASDCMLGESPHLCALLPLPHFREN